ncbi:serine/threonine-protein kinase [Streptomyces sp. NBC_01264]|uniref:serine/threonine-protein kinase n=1 Tax=Streptomyces sp. NBC_01264 TaxID=2903804 RepID=UPI002253A669|nr:serine/threonine-protein kinase [Streptomyces sp. NBC_01264]MCX4781963.1 serine/threonine protein kinase [Streptomyces sp. NBC_01264]
MESLRPGDPPEIGGYRLLARLGEGGMGEVFLARTASGRPLALKTVHRDLSRDPDFADRFAREIRANDRVRSAWTVSVVDFSAAGASPQWLATEYVAAPSLGEWVHRNGPLAGPALWSLARELFAALVAVRASGVVHRDIKPGNVLLGRERPYLIDFGIARAVHDPRHTRTGAVIGTPGFLAPEQATGAVAEAPADVFSLAAVLVHAATGHSPFLAEGEELELPGLLHRVVHDEPALDGVPEGLRSLLGECLAKAPRERPTADEALARIGATGDEWSRAAPPSLAADAGHREAELHRALAASQPLPVPVPMPPPPLSLPSAFAATPPLPSPLPGATRRVPWAVGAAAAAVLVVAATLVIKMPWNERADGNGDGKGGGSGSAPPSAPFSAMPRSWVGTWAGTGPGTPDADGVTRARTGEFSVTVTLNAGSVGDLVGRQVSKVKEVSTGRDLGCTEALELRQTSGDRSVFAAVTSHPTDPDATFACPKGNLYVLTMAEPDRLTLETEGAQSAGAPDTLTRGS